MAINSFRELEKKVNACVETAMTKTRDIIFKIVSQKVFDYYQEEVFSNGNGGFCNTPAVYQRTGTLMESLSASHITRNGSHFEFTVGFDDDYLTFRYPGNPRWKKNIPATGRDVLTWFNDKSHGGTVDGSHKFWDEAIEEIDSQYGSVGELFLQNLKATGLPIN